MVWVPLLAAIIVAFGAFASPWSTDFFRGDPEPEGRIVSPRDGEVVASVFTAEGRLDDIPSGHHVWLAVQVGNFLFPKEPEIPSEDRRWVVETVESGESAGSGFSLVLLLVGREGQDAIRSWLERGRTGAGFPGFEAIPESSRLDVARGLTTRG